MKKTLVIIVLLAIITVVMSAYISGNRAECLDIDLHTPSGIVSPFAIFWNVTGDMIYQKADGYITDTEKYIGISLFDVSFTVSLDTCFYTYVSNSDTWNIITFEISKGIDGDNFWMIWEIGL